MNNFNPIMEFYEYQIHKYRPYYRFNNNPNQDSFEKLDLDNVIKFGDIDDSPDNTCRRVGIEGTLNNQEQDTQLSSCDPITSLSGGEVKSQVVPFTTYDIENLYSNYKEFFAKYEVFDTLNDRSIRKIQENLTTAYKNQLAYINNLTQIDKTPDTNANSFIAKNSSSNNVQELIGYNNDDSILIRVDITKQHKIVFFGDFHGSFHTFFRILCRLHKYDIINLDTFQINEPYKIIFLGDILDRGKYALDILNIIFKLIAINNTDVSNQKIFYNRGNHEAFNIFERDGALREFKSKIANDKLFDDFLVRYIRLLNILPSAILLNCENNFYWCCHGGFPELFLKEKVNKSKYLHFISEPHSTHIRWNDFGAKTQQDFTGSSRGQSIIKYSHNGTMKFLDNNDIKFIIRGHQDSKGNSFLFNLSGEAHILADPTVKQQDKNECLFYNNTTKTFGYRVNGPIARLKLDKNVTQEYYTPVITISTNTDNKRYLNADSFALLRFDIKLGDDNNFVTNQLLLKNKIKNILSKPHINISSIFLVNLDMIKKMLEKIKLFVDTYNNLSNSSTPNTDSNSIKMLEFISDKLSICITFVDYYGRKFVNIKDRTDELINEKRFDDIQLASVNKYLFNYNKHIQDNRSLIQQININQTFTKNNKGDLTKTQLVQIKNDIDTLFNQFNSYNN